MAESITQLVDRVSFRDSDHSYSLDGRKVPSVTTLLGNLSKPALPWWAATEGANAVRDFLESNLDGVDPDPECQYVRFSASRIDEVFALAQRAHIVKRNDAGVKGNAVHAAIDAYHTEFFTAEPPVESQARKSWDAFIAWWSAANLTAISTERKIVDPHGRYAGRLDLLCENSDGEVFVCDIKTSKGVYAEMIYQNAGYAAAIEAETGQEVSGTKILWLPTGAEKLTVVERDRSEWLGDFKIFESLIDLHSHRKALNAWLKDVRDAHGEVQESTPS